MFSTNTVDFSTIEYRFRCCTILQIALRDRTEQTIQFLGNSIKLTIIIECTATAAIIIIIMAGIDNLIGKVVRCVLAVPILKLNTN